MKRIIFLLILLFVSSLQYGFSEGSLKEKSTNHSMSFEEKGALFSSECSKCHTIGKGERVGPDLKGINDKRDRTWLIGFISQTSDYLDSDPIAMELLEKYNGVRMDDVNLSQNQIKALLDYINEVGKGPIVEDNEEYEISQVELSSFSVREKKNPNPLGLVLLFITFLLVWPCWKHLGKISATMMLLLVGFLIYFNFLGIQYYSLPGNQEGYSPDQPIAFSHKLHAGKMKISCLYCHHGAEKSPVAGIPSVNICMNCHKTVKKRRDQNQPSEELKKLFQVWQTKDSEFPESIKWKKVYDLPDFVYFSHQVHVQNGLSCRECHGEVEKMEKVKQVGGLGMGRCLQCHRHQNKPSPAHWKKAKGTLDCSSCHI